MNDTGRSLLNACRHDLRLCWKQLVVTDIIYKVVAFVVLTPLIGMLFQWFVAMSGRSVLADEDIFYFFISPIGWASIVVVGAIWVSTIALEQAALMAIVGGATNEQRIDAIWALKRSASRAWPILQVTARMVFLGLITAAPFLVAAGLVYAALLTEYDINFYLAETPPVFWCAAGLGALIATALLAVLVRYVTSWFFAFPVLLFRQSDPHQTLRISAELAAGHRTKLGLWIAGWAVSTLALSTVGTGTVGLFGRLILQSTKSLPLLVFLVGLVLLIWTMVNIVITLLSSTTFSILLVNLYRTLVHENGCPVPRYEIADSAEARAPLNLSRRGFFGLAATAVIGAAFVGVVGLMNVGRDDNTQIMAHRGASGAAPENTLAAVQRAIHDGADWVEIDVQESADGVVLVVHDSDLKKVGGVDLKIWEATAADLRKVDIGSWYAPEFRDQRVPTLAEALSMCKGRVKLNIELKYYGHDQQLEQRVVDLVESHEMQSDVVIMSLKREGIRKVKTLRPQWKVGLLTAVAVGDLTQMDVDFLAVSTNLATRSFVSSARRSRKDVYVWTVNDPLMMSSMMAGGVEAIITDEPALARSVLRQRAGMSLVEHLLLEVAALLGETPTTTSNIDDV